MSKVRKRMCPEPNIGLGATVTMVFSSSSKVPPYWFCRILDTYVAWTGDSDFMRDWRRPKARVLNIANTCCVQFESYCMCTVFRSFPSHSAATTHVFLLIDRGPLPSSYLV